MCENEKCALREWAAEAAGLLQLIGAYQSGSVGEQIEACLARYVEIKREEAK
jgi:hypothetical protein